ncbi:unnamed protein product [Orchesella dallaii]|uniref:Protein quiver n=1 Tax=Orchesella dallaii TaxID=48710 RepID=A0ABP1PT73_9HEXA
MMNWASQVLLLSTFLILNEFQLSEGVKCYQCRWMNGKGDKGCQNSPPPSKYLTECAQPQCWKRYAYSKGRQFVERFCAAQVGEKQKCAQSTIEDEKGDMYPATECTCNTDGCNAASNFYLNHASIILLTVTLVSGTFINKLLISC